MTRTRIDRIVVTSPGIDIFLIPEQGRNAIAKDPNNEKDRHSGRL
jgi:hypothetical protein